MNDYLYRAVFTKSIGNATTSAATLTMQFVPTVTKNPANQSVTAGSNATLTVTATVNPAPTVQWQVSIDGGLTITGIIGANGSTLTLTGVPTGMSGYRYRAVFTNSLGIATTTVATLAVR